MPIQFPDVNSEPDKDVVAGLEEALKMAKRGELRTVTIVGDLTGNRTYTNFATNDLQNSIGSISFLLHTLCAKQRESEED